MNKLVNHGINFGIFAAISFGLMKVSVAKKMKLSHTLTSCLAETEFFVDIQSENCIQQQLEKQHPTAVIEKDGIKLSFYI